MVSWVRKGFLLPKWVKIFSRPFYMVLVFPIRNRKLSFAKDAFFLADSVIFDRIDYWDLIGIFVNDLISNRIGKFIFLKDRDKCVKWENLIMSNPAPCWVSAQGWRHTYSITHLISDSMFITLWCKPDDRFWAFIIKIKRYTFKYITWQPQSNPRNVTTEKEEKWNFVI
jgi:hypothetical protein